MQWKFILFDLDGTLTDSKPGILRCVQYALEACGCPESDETKLYPFIGPPLYDSFRHFCGMSDEQATFAVGKYRERFGKIGMFENAIYDGVPSLLTDLRDAGLRLAVATSKPEIYTLQILAHFHLTEYFHAIAGSDIQKEGEMKADVIRIAMQRLKMTSADVADAVMIGDRKHDVEGAHACGLPCIGVSYGYAPEGELKAFGASPIVATIDELKQVLLH